MDKGIEVFNGKISVLTVQNILLFTSLYLKKIFHFCFEVS